MREGRRCWGPFLLITILLAGAPGWAAEWTVPDNPGCGTIQACLVQAADTDIITVKPGTYVENVDFLGKAVTLRSQDGPETTTIDGNQAGPVVTFQTAEGNDSVLEGFTILNGAVGDSSAGGVLVTDASPTIRANVITANATTIDIYGYACGIWVAGGSPLILANTIEYNLAVAPVIASGYGIGLENAGDGAPVVISGNVIRYNGGICQHHAGSAGGFGISGSGSAVRITNNVIHTNMGGSMGYPYGTTAGAGVYLDCDDAEILHNTVHQNGGTYVYRVGIRVDAATASVLDNIVTGTDGVGLCVTGAAATADYNNVWDSTEQAYCEGTSAGPHDLAVDPGYVGAGDPFDLRLQLGSPCIDRGTDAGVTEDIEGTARPRGSGFDMGAYETAGGSPSGRFELFHYSNPEGPWTVTVADLDQDGILDLATANADADTLSVLLGEADGGFADPVHLSAGTYPVPLAAADLTGDGIPDLAAGLTDPAGDVSLLAGNGDGTFQAPVLVHAGGAATGLAAADLNEDGALDLAVANGDADTVSILLGNGDGTFQSPSSLPVGEAPFHVVAADLNGDDDVDLAVVNTVNLSTPVLGSVSVLLGNGDGTFQPGVGYPAGLSPTSAAVTDLNGDAAPDLVVANSGGLYSPVESDVSVLLGNGDGTFQAATNFTAGTLPFSVAAGDVDGDGNADVAVTLMGNLVLNGQVAILFGAGDGTLGSPEKHPAGPGPTSVVLAHLNGDDDLDMVGANAGTLHPDAGEVIVYLNKGEVPAWGAASTVDGRGSRAAVTLNVLGSLLAGLAALAILRRNDPKPS